MLGVLLSLKGSLHKPQTMGSSGAGQDKHVLLPLAPVVGRIQVLPMSSKSTGGHRLHTVSFSENGVLPCKEFTILPLGAAPARFYTVISAAKDIFFSSPLIGSFDDMIMNTEQLKNNHNNQFIFANTCGILLLRYIYITQAELELKQ